MSLHVVPAVKDALERGQPVVALESTVITHGLPRPRNLDVARELEAAVREAGATPATVIVRDGRLIVGASDDELARLAEGHAAKASLWNLAPLLAAGASAGTTVAVTLFAAARAGIKVFATGGIGGVHPRPFDESADLTALARYPVITVSAGPKSILLAGATLERLETLGVPVIGYRSSHLAGFHVPRTDLPLPASADEPEEIARAFEVHLSLGFPGGMLVSNPVSEGLSGQELERYREAAQGDAERAGVSGRDLTPYLLSRMAELSQERTIVVNGRLLHENADLAARIAVCLGQSEAARSFS